MRLFVFAMSLVAAATASTVSLRSTSLGHVLVGPNGHSLYVLTADKTKASTCYGACASNWPPLLVSRAPSAGTGVRASLLGTTKRKDGKLQVTYAGHPLYFFVQDTKAGQVDGQGVSAFGGTWWLLSAAGTRITTKPAPTTTTTPPAPTTTGYGYGR